MMPVMGMWTNRRKELEGRLDSLEASFKHICDQLERLTRAHNALEDAVGSPAPSEERLRSLEAHAATTVERMKELTQAVAHGIEHVERAENRVRATVGRAKRELDRLGIDHAGLDAEVDQIRERDAIAGGEEELPTLFDDVGDDQPDLGAIPGDITAENLRQLGVA